MSTDYPDPASPAESTDPGFKQTNTKVGANDEFTLPDVVPIINPMHTSRVGIVTQEVWVRANWLARGIAGTMVQWFVFFAEIGKAYPLPAYSFLLVMLTTLDEKFSTNPILTNTLKYAMTSYDPKAAEMIFAPKASSGDPVKNAARLATEEATKEYLASPEYQDLKQEIALDVQLQVRRQAYAAAGMIEEVKALDEEIAAERAEKRAEHLKAKEEAATAGAPADVPAEVPTDAPLIDVHQIIVSGASSDAPPEAPPAEQVPVEAPPAP